MKNLFLIILSLIAIQAQAVTFSIFSIENDTSTQGGTFTMIVDGANGQPTDTGRVYIFHPESSTFIQLFKINTNDLNTLTPAGGHYIITVTLPTTMKGNVYFSTNAFPGLHYDCWLRSNTPDLSTVPGFNGPFSGSSGFTTNLKFKWTYESVITDTVRFYLDGLEIYKIALYEIEDDSLVSFPVTGSPGNKELTANYSDFQYSVTINSPPTNVVEPFTYSTQRNVTYYDILGRVAVPKEGDLVRYTAYGAIIINQ